MTVARLVASGRSNREVAAELYVSVKAVEYHLGHVFDEIGIRSVPRPAGRQRPCQGPARWSARFRDEPQGLP
jgi:DNA-binding CsgD family transcriptional regulator